jgi:hypothetical protein
MAVNFTPAACNTCLASNCCEEVNGCFTVQDCDALDTCITTCLDEAGTGDAGVQCANDCFAAHKSSETLWKTQLNCAATKCKTDCGG